eukprot:4556829-Pleurochrysis_carterae.AAC.1
MGARRFRRQDHMVAETMDNGDLFAYWGAACIDGSRSHLVFQSIRIYATKLCAQTVAYLQRWRICNDGVFEFAFLGIEHMGRGRCLAPLTMVCTVDVFSIACVAAKRNGLSEPQAEIFESSTYAFDYSTHIPQISQGSLREDKSSTRAKALAKAYADARQSV